MYGWRLRIGLMLPASNTTMESEFWSMVPQGVSVHASRMMLGRVTEHDLIEMKTHVERAAKELQSANVDIIAFGCTTGSLVKGKGYDKELSSRITSITGIPSVTTSTAVLDALNRLDMKRIVIATPYIMELNALEARFFEDNGITVAGIEGLGFTDNIDIGNQEPYVAYKLVKKLAGVQCDGVFISCTNFRTIEVLQLLEDELQKPVISSNQATLAAVLRKGGISCKTVKGYGSLFTS